MRLKRLVPVLFGLCALAPAAASASFPAGVWGLVEDVTVNPDGLSPNRVRIDGLFMVANQMPDFPQYPGYSEPAYGYMYYDCPVDQVQTCVMEWADLLAASQSDNKCRGWGDNSFPGNGNVRAPSAPLANPDMYPISMGVLMGFSPCEALGQWMIDHPPPPVEGSTGGTSDGTGGTGGTGETATTGGGTTGGDPGTGGPASTSGTSAPQTGTEGGGSVTTGEATGGGATSGAASTGSTTNAQDESGGPAPTEVGCACRTDAPGPASGALMLLGLLALRRRR